MSHSDKLAVDKTINKHPAMEAWIRAGRHDGEFSRVQKLWEKKKGAISSVFRLLPAGTGGRTIIAKRILQKYALKERLVYEKILPSIPVTSLKYYGFLEEVDSPDGKFCWLFFEDAGEREISIDANNEVSVLGNWLARLHINSISISTNDELNILDYDLYLNYLMAASSVANKLLTDDRIPDKYCYVFEHFLSDSDFVSSRSGHIRNFLECTPKVFVHGDIQSGNMRIRSHDGNLILLPFDWVGAGIGSPAIDLQFFARHSVSCTSYYESVVSTWPDLSMTDVKMLSHLGRAVKIFKFVNWSLAGYREDHSEIDLFRYINLSRFAKYAIRMNDHLTFIRENGF